MGMEHRRPRTSERGPTAYPGEFRTPIRSPRTGSISSIAVAPRASLGFHVKIWADRARLHLELSREPSQLSGVLVA